MTVDFPLDVLPKKATFMMSRDKTSLIPDTVLVMSTTSKTFASGNTFCCVSRKDLDSSTYAWMALKVSLICLLARTNNLRGESEVLMVEARLESDPFLGYNPCLAEAMFQDRDDARGQSVDFLPSVVLLMKFMALKQPTMNLLT